MTHLAYLRVSTEDQNEARQLEAIKAAGCAPEAPHLWFIDKASGASTERPELLRLRQFARRGDVVVVHSIDRLARSLIDLESLVKEFTERGVLVRFLKEGQTYSAGTEDPMAVMLRQVMGAFAQFERSMIRERQREGIAAAKGRGTYKGREKVLDTQGHTELHRLLSEGVPKTKIAERLGISRRSVHTYSQTPAQPHSIAQESK
jgi:DNA invertase Pin-like site-specific DNA recombinase